MSPKRIIGIEFQYPGGDIVEESFSSGRSLLDFDIILFRPSINAFASYSDTYRGKASLSDYNSNSLLEASEHWKREINDALDAGKTVLVFCTPPHEVWVDTGRREYSGTGRNRQTTRMVEEFDNYKCLPVDLQPIASTGTSMSLHPKSDLLAPYWKEVGPFCHYQAYFKTTSLQPLLYTSQGGRLVGGLYRKTSTGGALIFLPDIDFEREEFVEYDKKNKKEALGSKSALQFGKKLLAAVVELNRALRNGAAEPIPAWAMESKFESKEEAQLTEKLLSIEKKIASLNSEKQNTKQKLDKAGSLRPLLYAKGTTLELAIIEALTLMGFKAASYKEKNSEFDVVFESPEGRLIGEAEGKDDKAIDITKMRQLEMNIHEDFEREEVTVMAKGVLFGNAYRLKPPSERAVLFTEKCLSAAVRNKTALVATPQLFEVARSLKETDDPNYKKACREAIISCEGEIVTFPVPVKLEVEKIVIDDEAGESALKGKEHNKSVDATAEGGASR
jgi:hypothetical protein